MCTTPCPSQHSSTTKHSTKCAQHYCVHSTSVCSPRPSHIVQKTQDSTTLHPKSLLMCIRASHPPTSVCISQRLMGDCARQNWCPAHQLCVRLPPSRGRGRWQTLVRVKVWGKRGRLTAPQGSPRRMEQVFFRCWCWWGGLLIEGGPGVQENRPYQRVTERRNLHRLLDDPTFVSHARWLH